MNESIENYLRIIYVLVEKQSDKSSGIKITDIAKEMDVSKPSVSSMIKKLTDQKYLKSKPYSKVFLTSKGFNEARKITHNHRVIEVFLKDVLNYDMTKVHVEAHRLEHAFSDESIKRLDDFLNNPNLSPFGRFIPHKNDDVVLPEKSTLDNLKMGEFARIVSAPGKGIIRRRLLDMGVVRGARVVIERVSLN